jgi:hypothetical protein
MFGINSYRVEQLAGFPTVQQAHPAKRCFKSSRPFANIIIFERYSQNPTRNAQHFLLMKHKSTDHFSQSRIRIAAAPRWVQ